MKSTKHKILRRCKDYNENDRKLVIQRYTAFRQHNQTSSIRAFHRAEFCKKNKLPFSTIRRWIKRYNEEPSYFTKSDQILPENKQYELKQEVLASGQEVLSPILSEENNQSIAAKDSEIDDIMAQINALTDPQVNPDEIQQLVDQQNIMTKQIRELTKIIEQHSKEIQKLKKNYKNCSCVNK